MPTTNSQFDAAAILIQPLRLREARRAHALFVDALTHHFDYFDEAYRQTVLAENTLWDMVKGVIHPGRILLLAWHQDRIVGYVIGSVPGNGDGQIYWLFVHPQYRGQNVGLGLLSRILKVMRAKGAIRASLITHDHAKYYGRQGFKLIRKEHDGKIVKYVLSYSLES